MEYDTLNDQATLTFCNRFPLLRDIGVTRLHKKRLSFSCEHLCGEHLTIGSTYNGAFNYYLKRVVHKPLNEKRPDFIQEDFVSLTCDGKKIQAAHAHLGSHDVLKFFYDTFGNQQLLTICALFPRGIETWCQVIGNACFGVRYVSSSDSINFTCGVQTSRHSISSTFSCYFVAKKNRKFLYFVTIDKQNISPLFSVEVEQGKWLGRATTNIEAVTLSIGYYITKQVRLSVYSSASKASLSPGLKLEWS